MCYFLTMATPLTLSEVRSMLPAGLAAHPVGAAEAATFRRLLPSAQTVATLLIGGCSCDLVRVRHPDPREDERHLRTRYSRMQLARDQIILQLERHRHRPERSEPPDGWRNAVVAFAAEHARNAGPTLYLLQFSPGYLPPSQGRVVTRTRAEVVAGGGHWLEEDCPVIVVR